MKSTKNSVNDVIRTSSVDGMVQLNHNLFDGINVYEYQIWIMYNHWICDYIIIIFIIHMYVYTNRNYLIPMYTIIPCYFLFCSTSMHYTRIMGECMPISIGGWEQSKEWCWFVISA